MPQASLKRWIRPLPERLINKIAAGEVIERPSAVLKELVENALDAGAGSIDITVEKSGLKSIGVLDNGCGIAAEQVEIAFSRHATSKIRDFNDLEVLTSYGFRGEALPSIGSVSRTRMVTRTAEAETGTEIIIEGGVTRAVRPVAAPTGTKIEVGDLFYNTPARRKFLKAEATEARHLTRTATAMALAAEQVRFSYRLNGRKVFLLETGADNPGRRTATLLTGDSGTPLVELEHSSEGMRISGFVAFPDACRQNRYGLYIFINRRHIQSPTLFHAVRSGYGEMLPGNFYPVGAVFLDIDPVRVDVNVHPTKAEVRLSEERMIHDLLFHTVRRTLRGSDDLPGSHLLESNLSGGGKLTPAEAIRRLRKHEETSHIDNDTPAFLDKLYRPTDSISSAAGNAPGAGDIAERPATDPETFSPAPYGGVSFLGRIDDLYLIFRTGHELVIIDQHTAHERVLYEQHLRAVNKGGAISQNLLFPININLAPDRYAVFEEAADYLKAIGFIAEPFGGTTVILSAVPTVLTKKSPEKMFHEILSDVEQLRQGGQDLKKAVAQSVACRSAVMAGDRLTADEALGLFRELMKAENRHCCPHGRPTILKITRDELDQKFGRK